jgi:hypothetical protein
MIYVTVRSARIIHFFVYRLSVCLYVRCYKYTIREIFVNVSLYHNARVGLQWPATINLPVIA